jgi:DNA polymerase-3 subunit alpha
LFSPKQWAKSIKAKGLKAHALTDHGTMAGCLPFYYAMKDEGLTPLLGCEFYYVDDPTDKTPDNRSAAHLILIAKSYEGWQNLLRLQKLSYTDGYYYRPRIGKEWLEKYGHDLVCTSACLGGVLSKAVWKEADTGADGLLEVAYDKFNTLFGDDFYIEYQGHNDQNQIDMNEIFNSRLKGNYVITNDCHFIEKKQHKIQELVKANAFGNVEAATSYSAFETCYLTNVKEVYTMFMKHHNFSKEWVASGLKNTQEIFEKCVDFKFPTAKHFIPKFVDGKSSREIFDKLTKAALKKVITDPLHLKYATKKQYIERYAKEYKVITKYGFEDYFLIIWDLVRFAQSKGIYVGLGRGSSAGSLIAYLLEIVQVNPLQYGLLFERFLNEIRAENGEMPDVDLDFESARRHEVKEYIVEHYGRDKVCEIGTYNRLKLKSSIIDFGKQFGFKHKDLLEITTKLELDKDDEQNLEAAMEASSALAGMVEDEPDFGYVVDGINGQIKSQSIHPAGVLVSSQPIAEVTPLKSQKMTKGKDRVIVTQSEDKYCLQQGLIKIDILGLKEYDIMKFCVENSDCGFDHKNYIKKVHAMECERADEEVWRMFADGKTEAVFQFASSGMKDLLRRMKPQGINDLIAAVALYRPGCLANGWHIAYCERKHGREPVEYLHESLKPFFEKTYGLSIFQEDFMTVLSEIGKIPLTQSDIIRSALGKKDEEKLRSFKKDFVKGATKVLDSKDIAESVWSQIEKASGYAFNLSHSAVYGILAYTNQWFKVHHTVPYWAAVLSWDAKKNKMSELITNKAAAEEMGVEVKGPDINESGLDFTCCAGAVRWSLNGIKGLGPKAVEEIVAKQPFTDFDDFYGRIHKAKVKFDVILNLLYAGAFDSLGDRKNFIMRAYVLRNAGKKDKRKCPSLTLDHMLLKYTQAMGFFEQSLKTIYDFGEVFTAEDMKGTYEGDWVCVGGMIESVRSIRTKNGDAMGKARIIDLNEDYELTFFPKMWASCRTKIKEGNIVKVIGKKSAFGGKENLIDVDELELIKKGIE